MTRAKLISFPKHLDENGALCVYEAGIHVPFVIQRVFVVTARKGDVRGEHSHKRCTQLLVCTSGKIRVACDNGVEASVFVLEDFNVGLLIPPGIWAREEYMTDSAVLMVMCDIGYDANDYIRIYSEFQASKKE